MWIDTNYDGYADTEVPDYAPAYVESTPAPTFDASVAIDCCDSPPPVLEQAPVYDAATVSAPTARCRRTSAS